MEQALRHVELFFSEKLYERLPQYSTPKKQGEVLNDLNFCCDEDEFAMLLRLATELKKVFPLMTDKDICIAVILAYYSLNLGEQTLDYLVMDVYKELKNREDVVVRKQFADDPDAVERLFLGITIGDIEFQDDNISSMIRRYLMGMPGGSNKKTKKTKKTKTKTKIYKKN